MTSTRSRTRRLGAILGRPFVETFHGLDHCLAGGGRELLVIFVGLGLGWWVYVPLHELLHALGCLATGGEVSRLEIDALYGGAILSSLIPWVVSGSEYAGRLSGFSTGGNDAIYLATDLAPYLLTLWPGLWAMRLGVRKGWSWLFGAMLPWALASFVSLTGDAYEIGSILATRLPPWSSDSLVELVRGDDLFLLPKKILESDVPASGWTGVVMAALLGLVWAYLWWYLAALVARLLGQAELSAPEVDRGAPAPVG